MLIAGSSLNEPTLVTQAVCPHCQFRPSAEQLELIPAANRLHKLDDDLDTLVANWQQTLLENCLLYTSDAADE